METVPAHTDWSKFKNYWAAKSSLPSGRKCCAVFTKVITAALPLKAEHHNGPWRPPLARRAAPSQALICRQEACKALS
jgi:hypothetical protein